MNNMQRSLSTACQDLGLEYHIDYVIKLDSGQQLLCPVHIPALGSTNGMLLFTKWEQVKPFKDELVSKKYGFSVLSDFSDAYDRPSTIEMFSDWSWNGPEDKKPAWMLDVSASQE